MVEVDRGNGLGVDSFGEWGDLRPHSRDGSNKHTLSQIKGPESEWQAGKPRQMYMGGRYPPGEICGQRVHAVFVQGQRAGPKVVSFSASFCW